MEEPLSQNSESKLGTLFVLQRYNNARIVESKQLLLFRLLSGITLIGGYLYESLQRTNPLDPLKAFTTWGVVMCGMFFLLSSFLQYNERKTKEVGRYPTLSKFTHVLFQVSFVNQLVITIVFWTLIYPNPEAKRFAHETQIFFIGIILTHGGIFILIWIEFIFNHLLLYWTHFFMVMLVGIIYYIMNITITLKYGPIYPVLTYKDFHSYLMITVSVLLSYIHFYIGVWFGKKYKKTTHELYTEDLIFV